MLGLLHSSLSFLFFPLFINESITLQTSEQATYQDDHQRDFIDSYLRRAREDPSSSFSPALAELNLRNTLVDFFMAGSDTTSATLRFT